MRGIIKKWYPGRRFGFIAADDDEVVEVFFHETGFRTSGMGFLHLHLGMPVTFRLKAEKDADAGKKPEAVDVSLPAGNVSSEVGRPIMVVVESDAQGRTPLWREVSRNGQTFRV